MAKEKFTEVSTRTGQGIPCSVKRAEHLCGGDVFSHKTFIHQKAFKCDLE